ncbi:MAG TPA: 5'/3'-nucleotidase SurE [Actinoplanes sp.]|jgi:5'-nucleotidase
MTRILVTNDDGVDAPGLVALARAARQAGFEVVVAAPREEASGMSAALTAVTADGRIVVERRTIGGLSGYGVAASPAYIVVLAALGAFGPPPDVVLSGINRGANAGHAVLHSGTVGAALTAANNGLRAMAVSLDVLHSQPGGVASGGAAITVPDDGVLHWAAAAEVARSLLAGLAEAPAGTVLNVNVPDRPAPAGLREAGLASFGQAQMAVAEQGEDFVRTAVEWTGEQLVPGTDLAWLAEGYATVTSLRPPAQVGGVHLPVQRSASP